MKIIDLGLLFSVFNAFAELMFSIRISTMYEFSLRAVKLLSVWIAVD